MLYLVGVVCTADTLSLPLASKSGTHQKAAGSPAANERAWPLGTGAKVLPPGCLPLPSHRSEGRTLNTHIPSGIPALPRSSPVAGAGVWVSGAMFTHGQRDRKEIGSETEREGEEDTQQKSRSRARHREAGRGTEYKTGTD